MNMSTILEKLEEIEQLAKELNRALEDFNRSINDPIMNPEWLIHEALNSTSPNIKYNDSTTISSEDTEGGQGKE
jgi:hypothetical protein